jgi:hypothetical protein
VKPVDTTKSATRWHDVPNRAGRLTIATNGETGDIGLSSGWQGDNSGATAPGNNDYVVTPSPRMPTARSPAG